MKQIDIKNFKISKYRTVLMGFAMIWIMTFHLPISFAYLNPIKGLGYLGVDIFIFLSSYGLYYGFKKNDRGIRSFYKKRILRILPSYYFVLLLTSCINSIISSEIKVTTLLQEATFLGFFCPPLGWPIFLWYIPAILTLYAIFPFIYKELNFIKKYLIIIIILILCCNMSIQTYALNNSLLHESYFLRIFIPRIIPFILGVIWADVEKYKFNKLNLSLFFIIGIISLLSIYIARKELPNYYCKLFMLETFPFLFALPLCLFSFSILYEYFPTFIQKIIRYAGKYSLELYLIHESLYTYTCKITNYYHISNYYIFPFTLLICFILAYCLNFTIKHILSLTKRNN